MAGDERIQDNEMNQGSISEMILKRSILKHIRRNRKDLTYGAGVGHDFSVLGETVITHGIADDRLPYSDMDITVSEMAYRRVMNHLALSCAIPVGIHIVMLVSNHETEQRLRREMEILNHLADERQIQILGGHTEVSSSVTGFTVSITAYGKRAAGRNQRKPVSGDCLLMTGYAGMFGISLIAASKKEELMSRFAESYIREAVIQKENLDITHAAETAALSGAIYMHDISFGGVYGAVSQTAEAAKLGICLEHEKVPVRQEGIELCEFYNLNPYLLLGTGALLIACSKEDAGRMEEALAKEGISASVIGTFTEQKEKIVVSEALNMRRHLLPPDGDEIYKLF